MRIRSIFTVASLNETAEYEYMNFPYQSRRCLLKFETAKPIWPNATANKDNAADIRQRSATKRHSPISNRIQNGKEKTETKQNLSTPNNMTRRATAQCVNKAAIRQHTILLSPRTPSASVMASAGSVAPSCFTSLANCCAWTKQAQRVHSRSKVKVAKI